MAGTMQQGWERGPIGYRTAQLESSDFTAAMTLFVAGIPALLVGADLVRQGIGMGQLILAAPIGAVLGALVIAMLGQRAASSGAPTVYLSRPALGSIPAALVTIVRLGLTVAWGAIILRVAGNWLAAALVEIGVAVPADLALVVVAVLGAVLLLAGPIWFARTLLRKRLFWIAVVVVLIAAWRVLSGTDPAGEEVVRGGFLEAVDAVFGLAILWLAAGGDLAGFGRYEEEAGGGLGLGFAIPALVFVLGGAAFAIRVDAFPDTLTVLGAGVVGGLLAIFWVPLMEVDGFSGLSLSGAFALESIIPRAAPLVLALVAAGGSAAAALVVPLADLRVWADLAMAVFAPAVGVMLVHSYVVDPGGYSGDELYRWRGYYGTFRFSGLICWLLGVLVALWMRPVGPAAVAEALNLLPFEPTTGLPALLMGVLAGGGFYLVVGLLLLRHRQGPYRLRGF
jgi:purine-cytosine permease-like protein